MMNIEILIPFLGWCAVINIGILVYWACFLFLAPGWLYRISSKWVQIPEEQFFTMHFTLYGAFKLAILFFNIAPYLALRIIS